MNRSLFVSTFALLSLAAVACTGDEESSAPAAPASIPAAETPAAPPAPSRPVTSDDPRTASEPAVLAPDAPPGPPAEWEPSQLADLAVWLRADKGTHSSDKLGGLDSWDDQSTHKNDAVAASASFAKVTKEGEVTGIVFSGSAALTIKDNASMQWKGDFSVVVVARSTQAKGSYGALFGKTTVAFPYSGPALFTNYPIGANADQGGFGGQVNIDSYQASSAVGLDDGKPRMFGLVRSGDQISVRVNGAAEALVGIDTGIDTSAIGVDAFIGGHPQKSLVQTFTGTIYEVIGVAGAVDATTYAKLYAYEKARYAIDDVK